MFVGNSVFPISFTLEKAAEIVEKALVKKNWHNFEKGDMKLVLTPFFLFYYDAAFDGEKGNPNAKTGRGVLARHAALPVTAWSILWGLCAMAPLAGLEWLAGARPAWTAAALWGTAYLALVVTALGYLVWNYALERVEAPRLALFINVQPVVGALLGVWWLREPLTVFTVAGGVLVLLGLHIAVRAGRMV